MGASPKLKTTFTDYCFTSIPVEKTSSKSSSRGSGKGSKGKGKEKEKEKEYFEVYFSEMEIARKQMSIIKGSIRYVYNKEDTRFCVPFSHPYVLIKYDGYEYSFDMSQVI